LIKGGVHLEHLGAIRAIAFDKTGTLTRGIPEVTDVVPFSGSQEELLMLAAGVEYNSAHPLARAIVDRAKSQGTVPAEVQDFESLTGAGAKVRIGETDWYVGKLDLFKTLGARLEQVESTVERFHAQGKTVVLVGNDQSVCGLLTLQDRIRPGMREIIRELHTMGVRVAMLTGDHPRAAEAVARELDIDDVRANLSPEEKVQTVKELERRFGAVLMVGDGVNDAPALAAATCGMAMGAIGSDAAIEAADVALMSEDLGKVAHALRLGRRVRRISRQNIVFSLILLAILIPSALLGMLSVAAAVFIHEVSELLAVANGLRVRKPLHPSGTAC